MKILVLSDSHGSVANIDRAINLYNEIDTIIFCGDGDIDICRIMTKYPEKTFHCVKGNNDFRADFDYSKVIKVGEHNIFITHGHKFYVKAGINTLLEEVMDKNISICVFGHTHKAERFYQHGIHFLNPGAIGSYNPSFATIEITEQGILTNTIEFQRVLDMSCVN